MALNVFSLLVGFLCFFAGLLMLFNQKPSRTTNVYLIIMLLLAGIQRFINGIEILGLTQVTYSPLKIRLVAVFMVVPVHYLFYRRLLQVHTTIKGELLHFILPTIFLFISFFIKLHNYTYPIFSSAYLLAVLILVNRNLKIKKRSILEKGNYERIKTLTLLMTLISISLFISSNYFLFSDPQIGVNLNDFYRLSSLLWLGVVIYIFNNPVFIFGEEKLVKNIQANKPQEFLIWSSKPLKSIEQRDQQVYDKISNKIAAIILKVQKLQKSQTALSTITFTATALAKEAKIPRSHVELIFKYHCHYSINDFSNLVKINYAVMLINKGYLETYTIDSLGKQCLFNSRFTFAANFKKFMGVSVSDFVLMNTVDKL